MDWVNNHFGVSERSWLSLETGLGLQTMTAIFRTWTSFTDAHDLWGPDGRGNSISLLPGYYTMLIGEFCQHDGDSKYPIVYRPCYSKPECLRGPASPWLKWMMFESIWIWPLTIDFRLQGIPDFFGVRFWDFRAGLSTPDQVVAEAFRRIRRVGAPTCHGALAGPVHLLQRYHVHTVHVTYTYYRLRVTHAYTYIYIYTSVYV